MKEILDVEQRKLLKIFQQFVLNRDSEDIRKELYEYLIMYVVYTTKKDGYLEKGKINSLIESEFHLKDLPKNHIDDGIKRLASINSIHEKDGAISLARKKIIKFSKTKTEVESLEKTILEELQKELNNKLKNEVITKEVLENFIDVFGKIFERFGISVAKIFVEREGDITKLEKFEGFSNLFKKKILAKIDKQYHSQIEEFFHEYFLNPSENLSKFLYSLAQSYVLSQILNVDPKLKQLQEISWFQKRVYLDTNILINLLFGGSGYAESIIGLIENTIALKAKLFISSKTVDEFHSWLENRKKRYKNFRLPSTKLSSALGKMKNDDPFLIVYSNSLSKDSNLKIETFSKKYENFESLLENKYSVKIEPTVEALEKTKEIEELRNKILANASHGKSLGVAFHDAYSILRIRQLRNTKPSDEIGPSTWFLTIDSTLAPAESEFFKEKKEIPSSVTVENWFQIISNFLSPSSSSEKTSIAFVKLFSSHFDTEKLNAEDYVNLANALADDSEFTLEQLKKIVGSEYIKDKLRKLGKKKEYGVEPTTEELTSVASEMQKISRGEFEKEIKTLKAGYQKDLQKLESRIGDTEGKISQIRLRWIKISTVIGLIFVSFLIDFFFFYEYFIQSDGYLPGILGFNIAIVLAGPQVIEHFVLKK